MLGAGQAGSHRSQARRSQVTQPLSSITCDGRKEWDPYLRLIQRRGSEGKKKKKSTGRRCIIGHWFKGVTQVSFQVCYQGTNPFFQCSSLSTVCSSAAFPFMKLA